MGKKRTTIDDGALRHAERCLYARNPNDPPGSRGREVLQYGPMGGRRLFVITIVKQIHKLACFPTEDTLMMTI
jgi:hypothetical protein